MTTTTNIETSKLRKYVGLHAELIAGIDNLREFVETLPAPETEDGEPNPHVTWAMLDSMGHIRERLGQALERADSM